jgi:hypothetical protein
LEPFCARQGGGGACVRLGGRSFSKASCNAYAADVIKNWIRNRYTIELLGTWEIIHNPDFKVVEFDHFN